MNDIEIAHKKLKDSHFVFGSDWFLDEYFKDKNDNDFPDKYEKLVSLEKDILKNYAGIFEPDRSFMDRARAFFSASNKAGRGAKAVKDFALLFTPYGKQISSVTEFVSERFIKSEQNEEQVMNDSKPWYKSVTVNSIIVIIVLGASQFLGIEIAEAELQNTIEAVGMAVASVTALWGRIRAQTRISSK